MSWIQAVRRYALSPPPVLFGPFLFFARSNSKAVRLRWRLLRNAFPTRPRWQWWLLFLLIAFSWYSFGVWLAIWKTLKWRKKYSIDYSPEKSLGYILILGLWYGIHPWNFFAYGLFERSGSEWIDFVYPQEHPNWHLLFSASQDSPSREHLSNKDVFAKILKEAGLPSIQTLLRFKKECFLRRSEIFKSKSLFFKPVVANAMRGCFELHYESHLDKYRLVGRTWGGDWCKFDDRESIIACLNAQIVEVDYLVQPLLKNHPKMIDLFDTEELITLRVITYKNSGKPCVVYVVLEVPIGELEKWVLGNVIPEAGRIASSHAEKAHRGYDYSRIMEPNIGREMPLWEESKELLCRSHELFPDLTTIGWDLALTEIGPVVIEGNSNWNVFPPQSVSGRPLLSTLDELQSA